MAILPGSTIGVLGGGQLGRMFAIAARRMGYRVHTFSPEKNGPAAQFSDWATVANYGDEAAVAGVVVGCSTSAGGVDVLVSALSVSQADEPPALP